MRAFKLTALAMAALITMVAILSGGWIIQNVEAVTIETPFTVRAAPHFSDVVYSLAEPTYQTAFDGGSGFKVSTGTPRVALSDSKLNLTATSTAKVELTLSSTDAAGINSSADRMTFQTRFRATSVGAQWSNWTVINTRASDSIVCSLHASTARYAYSDGSSVTSGVLYSPVTSSAWYTFAMEITTTGVTWYIYDDTGLELNNFYSNTADLRAGSVNEVRYSVQGNAGAMYVDYMYCTGDAVQSWTTAGAPSSLDVFEADQEREISGVLMDPAKQDMSSSGNAAVNAAFDIPQNAYELFGNEELTREEILQLYGQTPEIKQRQKGGYYAAGWENFKSDLERSLEVQIASFHGVSASEVYLVDYYISWLEIGTTLDADIVAAEEEAFWAEFEAKLKETGGQLITESDQASSLSMMPMAALATTQYSTMSWSPLNAPRFIIPVVIIVGAIIVGAIWGAYALSESVRGTVQDIVPDLEAAARAQAESWERMYNNSLVQAKELQDRLSNMTERAYTDLREGVGSMLTTVRATVNESVQAIDDTVEKVQNGFASMYENAAAQFQSTNAMFSQMFNQTTESVRLFNGQLAKQNEAVMNISQGIFSGQYGENFWTEYLGGGKPDSGPLSQVGFFGTGLTTQTIVIIVIAAIVVLAMIAFIMTSRGKKRGRKKR